MKAQPFLATVARLRRLPSPGAIAAIAAASLALAACDGSAPSGQGNASPAASPAASAAQSASVNADTKGLKLGALLPATGDLASIGQPMLEVLPLFVETVNACGGVNGEKIGLVTADDQTDPTTGAEAVTKLVEVDKVSGVVGSFASSVSGAAVDVAARNQVVLISPGSTSPVFTERAKKGEFKGFWARTAPPDTYQAEALAKLAKERGLTRVATIAINNDYGVGFEQKFVAAFKKLGGTVINEKKPTRYDPKASTFDTEVTEALSGKPEGLVALLYVETGSLLLKAAYEQGLTKGVQILLTDGVKTTEFPTQVGKSADGKYIISGAIGTVPGADGTGLKDLTALIKQKLKKDPAAFVPQTWDAAALLTLAAAAAKANTGAAIQSKLREVANAPGEEVSDICKAITLVKAGKDINYQGASGNVDVDENGDVVGNYDIWKVGDDGKIAVTGKVKLEK